MTNRSLQPGDKIWVLNSYSNQTRQRTVANVGPMGVRVKEATFEEFDFTRVFDSEADAVQGMAARAEAKIRAAEKNVVAYKTQLRNLQRKYPAILTPAKSETAHAQ